MPRGSATTARRDGEHYVLNGAKIYITNAPDAGLFTVFATRDPALGSQGISAFVVDAATPGLTVGRTVEMAAGRGSHHAELAVRGLPRAAANLLRARARDLRSRCAASMPAARTGAPTASVRRSGCSISPSRAPRRARPSASGCASIRASNGCWPTWRPPLHAARLVAYEAAWRYDGEDAAARTRAAAMSKLIGADMVQKVADTDAADLRRLGLFEGPADRADLARDPRGAHPRRHLRDDAPHRRPRPLPHRRPAQRRC